MEIKQKNGISLIVLAITIIVMIILATVIILSLSGSNMKRRAKEAVAATDILTAKELIAVARAEWELDEEKLREEGYNNFSEYANKKLQKAGIDYASISSTGALKIIFIDKNGDKAVIPDGFVVSEATGENTIEYGLVIYEGSEAVTDDNVEIARETRNQFVWIPVPDVTKFERTTTYDGTTIVEPTAYHAYSEPCSELSSSNDLTEEWKEYTTMKKSVEEYGGFYIGRYEAGTTSNREISSTSMEVLVQKNKNTYNWVEWGTSLTEVGTKGAVYLSRELYNTSAVKSTLCYGVQWDAALNFIATSGEKDTTYATNSEGKGWNKNNFSTGNPNLLAGIDVGTDEANKLNNIYDMAGNVWEWTMEAQEQQGRVIRGGGYGTESLKASSRTGKWPNLSEKSCGFRITLYLK